MAKHTKFVPVRTTTGNWRLNVPARYSAIGKREQRFFQTQALALAEAKKLRLEKDDFGSQARSLPPAMASMTEECVRLLKPYGASILDVVKAYVAEQVKLSSSVLISDAIAAFTLAKDNRSAAHKASYKTIFKRLAKDFDKRMLASITGEELADHVAASTGTASSANQVRRMLIAFWNWCAEPKRAWCDASVIKFVDLQSVTKGEIGIFTPDECTRIMRATEEHFPECVPILAVALFTGIRQAEIARLTAADFTEDGIRIRAANAKTENGRFVKMSKPLKAWLAAYPIGDTFIPNNWTRKEKAIRRLAGFEVWTDLVPIETTADKLPPWKSNGLRHTAATVALAMGKPMEQLIFEHGHAGGTNTLKSHYIGPLTKAEALKIWSIRPHLKK